MVAQDVFINGSGPLPTCSACCPWAEKEGTFNNTDRRVQRVRQAIPPRGQSRPDWEIICDLARASSGWAARFTHRSLGYEPEDVFHEQA